MSVTHGARTDVMDEIAASLRDHAAMTGTLHHEADRAVVALGHGWHGPDAERFAARWTAVGPRLTEATERLRELARALDAQARQQDRASAAGGSGPGTMPLGPPGPAHPLPTLPPDFSDTMRGTTGQPEDKVLWKLAWHSYGPDNDLYGKGPFPAEQPPLPPGWAQLDDAEIARLGIDPDLLKNPGSGFEASLYRDENGRYVLAYRGSDEAMDWPTNFAQGLGLPTGQYLQAMRLATALQQAVGDNAVITGHSLGGGLAAAGAMATGLTAVTFDAAGPSQQTADLAAAFRGGGETGASVLAETSDGQMRAYRTDTDILTGVQEHSPLAGTAPDAAGTPLTLHTAPSPEGDYWREKGSAVGAVAGSLLLGLPTMLPPFAELGAAVGAQLGAELGTGAYGHHWHSMDAAMEALYPS